MPHAGHGCTQGDCSVLAPAEVAAWQSSGAEVARSSLALVEVGDEVTLTAQGIGTLTNTIMEDAHPIPVPQAHPRKERV